MSVPRFGPGRRIRYGMAIGPFVLLASWVLLSALGDLDRRVLSEPWTVLATFGELTEDGRLQAHLLTSAPRADWKELRDDE